MRKTFLQMTVICAAASMLAASASAQAESQGNSAGQQDNSMSQSSDQNNQNSNTRSWSSKHLTATGRNMDHSIRASKLPGARVIDSSGQRAGTIQDVIVNPNSGRIEFALLSLDNSLSQTGSTSENNSATSSTSASENGTTSYSANNSNGKLVPVPWSLLRTSASSQYSAVTEQPTFTVNTDRNKLSSAPSVDLSDLSQSEWQQRIYSYYGVTPHSSVGGAETPEGEIKGEGARRLQQPSPDLQQ